MKSSIFRIIFVISLILNFQVLFAQERKYSSTSKKAIDRFEKAIAAFDSRLDDEAEMYLLKAIDVDPNFIEAYTVLGDLYSNKRKSEKAIENYKKALAIDPAFFSNNYNSLGEEQLKLSQYAEAKNSFNKFLKTEIKS